VAVGLELDIPFETIQHSLASFTGVFRRFQIKADVGGVVVVDDYAHHPTEIRATLQTATEVWPDRRIVAVFQPHLFSRTKRFLAEFASSFFDANVLVVTDVYPARERPIPDVHGGLVADLAVQNGHRHVHYVPDKDDLPGFLSGMIRDGDVVIMLGAGDIWRASERLADAIQADAAHE
jgi:UDP-N-acetylmuramate--alanine ligase